MRSPHENKGKLADLVVVSADYFNEKAVPDEKIKDLYSVLTIVGGKVCTTISTAN